MAYLWFRLSGVLPHHEEVGTAWLGSVVALTDSIGSVVNTYSYDPYGNTKSSTGTVTNPWRFGGSYGAYHDADTGLYKIGMRYYSPELGRWTQQDPLAHLYDPVQMNRYAYAGCNPSNLSDPTGAGVWGCAYGWVMLAGSLLGVVFSTAIALVVAISWITWLGGYAYFLWTCVWQW